MLKTILVATDGSECAEKATELAADMARTYDARLILLHVWQVGPVPEALRHMAEVEHLGHAPEALAPGEAPLASTLEGSAAQWEIHETVGQNILNMARGSAQEFGAQVIQTVLKEGDPVTEILRCAEDERADLIVMGSRGLNRLKRLLLGSVSHKLAQLAPCPTLTVK